MFRFNRVNLLYYYKFCNYINSCKINLTKMISRKICVKSSLKGMSLQMNSKGTLHKTFQWTLLIFRVVGLFPLNGLSHSSSDNLRYVL